MYTYIGAYLYIILYTSIYIYISLYDNRRPAGPMMLTVVSSVEQEKLIFYAIQSVFVTFRRRDACTTHAFFAAHCISEMSRNAP